MLMSFPCNDQMWSVGDLYSPRYDDLYGLKDLTGSNSMSIGSIHPMDPLPPYTLGYIQRIGEPTLGYNRVDALPLHSRIMINGL